MGQPSVFRRIGFVLLVAVFATHGCSSGDDPERPSSPVRMVIETPAPNEVTGPDVLVKLRLIGGTVVERTTGELTPTEGHIHLRVDGKLESMNYTTEHQLRGLPPGSHSVDVEFVAVDHAPFTNRPRAAVLFTVQ